MQQPKKKKQGLRSKPNDAFLRRYGYTIKPSRSDPRVGVVYDRNGNIVKPAEYNANIERWNNAQRATRQESQRRATQKEPYQAQTDIHGSGSASRMRRQAAKLTPSEVHRLQSQTENVLSGGFLSPAHIAGAAARKIDDPSRDFTELWLTGYDDKGPNTGIVSADWAKEHPGWAIGANLLADLATGVRFKSGTPEVRTSVDTYGYRSFEPPMRVNMESVNPMLEGRKLPAVHGGSALEPVGMAFDQPPMLNRSPNIIVRPDGSVVPVETPHSVVPYSRSTSVVPYGRATNSPIDLVPTGSYTEVTPGVPGGFYYGVPGYPGVRRYYWPPSEDELPSNNIPGIEVTGTPPSGGGRPASPSTGGNGRGGAPRTRRTTNGGQYTAAPEPVQEPRTDLGPAVLESQLLENRTPEYSPVLNAMSHQHGWSPVTDMNGNTIVVRGTREREVYPDNYQNVPEFNEDSYNRMMEYMSQQEPYEYGWGGYILPIWPMW